MYKNIVFDFGGVMVDFDPYEYLIDLFGNHEVEDEVFALTFGSEEWQLLDAGRITPAAGCRPLSSSSSSMATASTT